MVIDALRDYIEPWAALIIGALAGYLVVRGVKLLEKLQIDDTVGAFFIVIPMINNLW